MLRVLLLPPVVFLLVGCGDRDVSSELNRVLCPLSLGPIPGIIVEIRDAQSQEPAAAGAIGIARDGAFEEVLQPYGVGHGEPSLLSLAGAFDRPGEYEVVVQKSGYADWSARNVEVIEGACGVVSVTLQANLDPLTAQL